MKKILFASFVFIGLLAGSCSRRENNITFTPEESSIERRVDAMLRRMSLEEKIGQLNQYDWSIVKTLNSGSFVEKEIKKGRVGSLLNIHGAKKTRDIQKIAVEKSRLGIPVLFATDVIHGYKTIFPIPLGEAASWDLEAIEKSARTAAVEASAAGLHWTFAPMVDISRDPRWGRVMEGAGEDPYLGSRIAAARVRGFQGRKPGEAGTILACAKHFAGYGAVEAGKEYNTVIISKRNLREVYLPPFKAAVDAGVATVMNSFSDFDGVPASGSRYLVHDILKTEWGFKGFTVSDYGSFWEMIVHGVAANRYEAAELAMNAGSDMDMQSKVYIDNLANLVKDGKIKESQIDDAVRRVLRMKFQMGLFDDPYRYCDQQREKELLLCAKHLEAARDVARKSIVLLKNEGNLLPLKKDIKTIAVIGQLADSKVDMFGNWYAEGDVSSAVTLLTGIRDKVGGQARILYAQGYEKYGAGTDELIDKAADTAKQADVIVLVIGENGNMSGECASRANPVLPGREEDLVRAIHKTGKPTVVVLMNGRPLIINQVSENMQAILETWFLGTQAGNAVADVLFGDYNPSGKLPMSFPCAVGQIPVYYSYKNTGKPSVRGGPAWGVSKYSDIPNEPLYPFGFGLSYTTFEYSDVKLSKNRIKINEPLEIKVTVKNTGQVEGEEVVQLYIRDLVASVTRPVKELKGFQKINLSAGESKEVVFTLTSADLAFYDRDMNFRAEPGEFKVFVGTNSQDVKEASFYLE